MKTMRKLLSSILTASTLFSPNLAFAACDSGEQIIRMSHINRPFNHPIGDAASELEQRINTELDGLACMEVFGNSLLYTDDRVVDALLGDDIQLAIPSYGALDEYTRNFRVFAMPFVFKNINAVERFQESAVGRSLLISMRGFGIRGLDYWQTGMLQFSANRPLNLPTAAQNLTFRTTGSTVSNVQLAAMGAYARPISYAALYGALESNQLDGAEESWANFNGKKIYKVQSDLTETNHAVGGNVLIASHKWYTSLAPEVKKPLMSIILEVSRKQRAQVETQEIVSKQAILDDGGNISALSAVERTEWRSELKGVFNHFAGDVNPVIIRMIDRLNADQ